jgi:hypothetical protein
MSRYSWFWADAYKTVIVATQLLKVPGAEFPVATDVAESPQKSRKTIYKANLRSWFSRDDALIWKLPEASTR